MVENGRGQEEKQVLGASWEEMGLGTMSVSEYDWGVCPSLGRCGQEGKMSLLSWVHKFCLFISLRTKSPKNQAAGLFHIQYILCSQDGSGVNNLRGDRGELVDFIHHPSAHLSILYPQIDSCF